ncbi:MAG TPA: SRPBCC domain-containing protein, partial [Thermoanaerobaculia bacterium]
METTEQQVSVTRTIRASRQRVFRAWTEPELMMRWFVEGDWEMSLCEIDLRPGGTYRFEGATGDKKWA